MWEKEAIQETINTFKKSINFFSNANKKNREIWVLREFLKNLGIAFSDYELQLVADNAPDVIFRDAAFEVKEVDNKGVMPLLKQGKNLIEQALC